MANKKQMHSSNCVRFQRHSIYFEKVYSLEINIITNVNNQSLTPSYRIYVFIYLLRFVLLRSKLIPVGFYNASRVL